MIKTLTLIGFAAQLQPVLSRLDVQTEHVQNLAALTGNEEILVVVDGTGIRPMDALSRGPVFFYTEGRLPPEVFSHPNCIGTANRLATLCARLAEVVQYLDWEEQLRVSALISEHKARYIEV